MSALTAVPALAPDVVALAAPKPAPMVPVASSIELLERAQKRLVPMIARRGGIDALVLQLAATYEAMYSAALAREAAEAADRLRAQAQVAVDVVDDRDALLAVIR